MKPKITVERLARPEQCGDWHDKPLKWCAAGPGNEVQKFATQKDAKQYAKLRRNLTEHQAQVAFVLA